MDSVQGGGDDVPLNAGLGLPPGAAGEADAGDATPDPRFGLPPVETPSLDRKSTTVAVNDLIAGLPTRYGAVLRGEAADNATSAKGLTERVREGLGLTLDEHIGELERNFHIKPQVSAQLRREGAAAQAPFLMSASQLEGDRYGAELRAHTGAQLDRLVDDVKQTPERLPVMIQSARRVVANAETAVLGEGEGDPLLRETQRKLGLAALEARLKRGPAGLLGYIKAGGAAELKPLGVSDAEIAQFRAQAQSAIDRQTDAERKAREAAAATRGLTGFIRGTTPFDPTNPAHVRTAEAGFEAAILPRLANPATAAEGAAAAVAYVKALKVVPPGLASWLGRGLVSANPEEAARAAEVYAAIAEAAPGKLPEGAGNPQSLYAMTIAALRRQGYTPADAVRVAGERVLRSTRDSQGFLARDYDADRPAIEAGTARFLAGAGVALGAEGRARFDAMVREAYARTGEIDAARAVALMQWRRGEGAPSGAGSEAAVRGEIAARERAAAGLAAAESGGERLDHDIEVLREFVGRYRTGQDPFGNVDDETVVQVGSRKMTAETARLLIMALAAQPKDRNWVRQAIMRAHDVPSAMRGVLLDMVDLRERARFDLGRAADKNVRNELWYALHQLDKEGHDAVTQMRALGAGVGGLVAGTRGVGFGGGRLAFDPHVGAGRRARNGAPMPGPLRLLRAQRDLHEVHNQKIWGPKWKDLSAGEANGAFEANTRLKHNLGPDSKIHPPYLEDGRYPKRFSVYERSLIKDTRFVRVFVPKSRSAGSASAGEEKPVMGSWLMRLQDFERTRRYPDASRRFQELFALKESPTHFQYVDVPRETILRYGIAGPHQNWGRGGGLQFQIITEPRKQWFKPMQAIR